MSNKRPLTILVVILIAAAGIYYYFNIYSGQEDTDPNVEEVLEPEAGEVALRYKKYEIEETLKHSLAKVTDKDTTIYLYKNEVGCDTEGKFKNSNSELILKFIFTKDAEVATSVSFFKRVEGEQPLEISGQPDVKNEINTITSDGTFLEASLDFKWDSRQALGEFKADVCSTAPPATE